MFLQKCCLAGAAKDISTIIICINLTNDFIIPELLLQIFRKKKRYRTLGRVNALSGTTMKDVS